MELTLAPVESDEVDDAQAVIDSDPGYTERITGLPPRRSDARNVLMVRPPELPEERKTVFGVRRDGELVGLLDVLRGYPDPHVAWIGLLLVRGDLQGRGVGRAAHEVLLEVVRAWPEISRLRLSVVATNDRVVPFWEALGYESVGAPVPYAYDNLETTAQRFERAV